MCLTCITIWCMSKHSQLACTKQLRRRFHPCLQLSGGSALNLHWSDMSAPILKMTKPYNISREIKPLQMLEACKEQKSWRKSVEANLEEMPSIQLHSQMLPDLLKASLFFALKRMGFLFLFYVLFFSIFIFC